MWVLLLTAVRVWLHPPAYASYGEAAGGEVCLYGRVYAKEYKGGGAPVLTIYVKPKSLIFQEESIPFQNNFICRVQAGEEPAVGSLVTVRGVLKECEAASNPGQFDERSYYAAMGVSAHILRAEVTGSGGGDLREALWKLKVFLGRGLERIFPEGDAALLKAMLLGDKSAPDAETKALYAVSGIMHILAVSGMHITFLGLGLHRLLRRAGLPVVPSALAAGAVMVLYGMMIGLPVSAVRAIGMFLLRLAAECIGRSYDALTALFVCAAVMLIKEPLYLCHAGFLLSFLAVYAAVALKPAVKPEGKLPPFLDGFFVSLSIAVFTLPVQLYFYYEAPVYAVFFNLAVIPLAGIVLALGAAALAVSFLLPGLAALMAIPVRLIFSAYAAGSRFLGSLPGSLWTGGRPKAWQIIGFYLVTGLLLGGKKLKWKFKMGLLCGAVLLLSANGGSRLRITFLDVGQGDGICLEMPDGSAWLCDGGSTSVQGVGAYRLEPFLKSRGIACLDGIFVSHSDADHTNGVEELLLRGRIKTKLLILPCTEKRQNGGFEGLLALAEERGIPVLWMKAGMEWESGGVSVRCLHPAADFQGEDNNAASQVLYVSYGNFSMLLTGDVGGEGEALLLQRMQAEGTAGLSVLKAAHHGSKYSMGEAFLGFTAPRFAVISAGKNNLYGHPHKELLERLRICGAEIMVTYETGAVMIETDGETMRVEGFLKR